MATKTSVALWKRSLTDEPPAAEQADELESCCLNQWRQSRPHRRRFVDGQAPGAHRLHRHDALRRRRRPQRGQLDEFSDEAESNKKGALLSTPLSKTMNRGEEVGVEFR